MCLDDPLVPIRGTGLQMNVTSKKNKIGQKIAVFAANDEMDGHWYEELPTLNRVSWRGAMTRTNLPSIYL